MFISPNHSQRTSTSSVSPSHGKLPRDQLSTTTSDDVFVSPAHAANLPVVEESTGGGESSEFDAVKRSESTLEHVGIGILSSLNVFSLLLIIMLWLTHLYTSHMTFIVHIQLTLSRPRGPVARKKPRRASAPLISQATPSSDTATVNKSEAKVLTTDVQQKEEKNTKEPLLKDDVTNDKEKAIPSSSVDSRVTQPEHEKKITEERMRVKSTPEIVSDNLSQVQLTDNKKDTNMVLDAGEDMTDGGEQRRRRGSQKDGRSSSLKVHAMSIDNSSILDTCIQK